MTKDVVKKPIDRLKAIIDEPTVQEQFKNALGKHSDLFVASLIDVFNSIEKIEKNLLDRVHNEFFQV